MAAPIQREGGGACLEQLGVGDDDHILVEDLHVHGTLRARAEAGERAWRGQGGRERGKGAACIG